MNKTKEDRFIRDQAIVNLFKEGEPSTNLSEHFGMSREMIRLILNKYGVTKHDGGRHLSVRRQRQERTKALVKRQLSRPYLKDLPFADQPRSSWTKEQRDLANKARYDYHMRLRTGILPSTRTSFATVFKKRFGVAPVESTLFRESAEWREAIRLLMWASRLAWYQRRGKPFPKGLHSRLMNSNLSLLNSSWGC